MVVTEKRVQLSRYGDLDYPKLTDAAPNPTDAEYVEQFRHALVEAVRIRLRADVPVGCYLSGGIDSCAIVGLAARHHPEPIRAFTLRFERPEYDEGKVAKAMDSKTRAEFYPIPIQQDHIADKFAGAIGQAETICVNAHGVAKYLLSRAVRKAGYKVVLTGEGSDEMLGGYLHFRRDMAIHDANGRRPGVSAASVENLEKFNPPSPPSLPPNYNTPSLQ